MHTYIAFTGTIRHMGGIFDCLAWGKQMVLRNNSRICKIVRVRKGIKNTVLIAEITDKKTRFLSHGRTIELNEIIRRTNAQKTN